MIEHDGCKGCKYELEKENSEYCTGCTQNAVDKYTRQTEGDKIRNKTDEELAEFLCEHIKCHCCFISEKCNKLAVDSCIGTFLAWLQQEVEE